MDSNITTLKKRIIAGKVYSFGRLFPLPPDLKYAVLVFDNKPGFLKTILESHLFNRQKLRVNYSPLNIVLPGKGKRIRNPGLADAENLAKEGYLSRVARKYEMVKGSNFIMDLSPIIAYTEKILSKASPIMQQDLTLKMLKTYIPDLSEYDEVFLFFNIAPTKAMPKSRLANARRLENIFDRLLYSEFKETEEEKKSNFIKNPSLVFGTIQNNNTFVRLDWQDPRLSPKEKFLMRLSKIESLASGLVSNDIDDVPDDIEEDHVTKEIKKDLEQQHTDIDEDTLQKIEDVVDSKKERISDE
jgi:hypothetical protein